MTNLIVLATCLGIAHWVLVPLALEHMFDTRKNRLWAIPILSLTCFGSLTFFLAHPKE